MADRRVEAGHGRPAQHGIPWNPGQHQRFRAEDARAVHGLANPGVLLQHTHRQPLLRELLGGVEAGWAGADD